MNADRLVRQNAEVLRHARDVLETSDHLQQKCRALDKRVAEALLGIPITVHYRKKPAKLKDRDPILSSLRDDSRTY